MDVVRAAIAESRLRADRRTPAAPAGRAGAPFADLTHLLAELIENAACSPRRVPRCAARRAGRNGFVLEIDDRVSSDAGRAAEANLRLAETPEFELSDTDRLGLFRGQPARPAASPLRVSLRPSLRRYHAVVLVPAHTAYRDGYDTAAIGSARPRTRSRRSLSATPSTPSVRGLDGIGGWPQQEHTAPLAPDEPNAGRYRRRKRAGRADAVPRRRAARPY